MKEEPPHNNIYKYARLSGKTLFCVFPLCVETEKRREQGLALLVSFSFLGRKLIFHLGTIMRRGLKVICIWSGLVVFSQGDSIITYK